MNKDNFYFGCWQRAGHFLHNPSGHQVYDRILPPDFPVREGVLDCGFLPPRLPQVEGKAILVHFPGWTILAFWDRSVDERGGCNSAFIMRGVYGFENAVSNAKEFFPTIWARFKFSVVEWDGQA